ncbi:MAG: hypothetical protein GTO40_09980, partial [Deltaproteobacteria bacterium]|nr:hypothetical protein [Deltaproteobacteria bacterium]
SFEKAQVEFALAGSWGGLGYAYSLSGDLESGQKYIQKNIKYLVDKGVRMFLSLNYVLLSVVHFTSGDFQKAEDCAKEALTVSQKYDQKDYEGVSMIWLGRILGKEKPSPGVRADEYIIQGMKICDELNLKPWSAQGYLFLGELYADKGQREKALENLKKAGRMFQEMGMEYWLSKTREVQSE